MGRLANANDRTKVIKALRKAGFTDQQGSKHLMMVHADGRFTTIPNARRLNVNTLRAILKQTGLTEHAFLQHYRGK